ncbi:MAG: RNA polymerase sigma factor [Myxococcales bacterium]
MSEDLTRRSLEAVYRSESRRVLATLIRLLGTFEAAEEALHDAFAVAAERWQSDGMPANPYAWLVSTGRFRAIDRRRRQARLATALPDLESEQSARAREAEELVLGLTDASIQDDELRLIFTCCHPLLAPDARVALTLREVCGLTTEEIARAYLVPTPTIAQRIVRAKQKIRDVGIPYEVPAPAQLPERFESVLSVVYLIFNEGYAATEGPALTRDELAAEAIRLGRLLVELSQEPEALGLLALMLLHESRRTARVDARGDLVLLEEQDRSSWDRALIEEAQGLIEQALRARRVGPYLLQAAIASVHAEAATAEATDWPQIVGLYDVLGRVDPSPIVALNRAVALGMRDGPEAGLAQVDALMADKSLQTYHLAHAARAEWLRRLGRSAEARAAFERALELTRQPAERRFLEGRMGKTSGTGTGTPC